MSDSTQSRAPRVDLAPESMGAQGDAVATFDGRRVFIPGALPGEKVRASLREKGGDLVAADVEIITAAPERVTPPCRHFGACGGCSVQHWAEPAYRAWKVDLLSQALRHHGLALPERLTSVFLPAGNRRRAEFAAAKLGGRILLGFQEAGGQEIVDQLECPILAPALARLVPALRTALQEILAEGERADVLAIASATGFDLAFSAARAPSTRQRQALAAFAEGGGIARLTWRHGRGDAEPIVQLRPPQIRFGDVSVDLPAGAFLQPSEAGEQALRSAALGYVTKAKRIAELYAGCGSFTFDLAKIAKVHAVEGSKPALLALDQAARRAQVSHRISTEQRDLERAPLTPMELKAYDAVVFDPPRAGAKAQSDMLARAAVRQVVAISCNPATFARDARRLVDGGYALRAATVVDQFVWSAHVEVVADFSLRRT